ncbi:MAG: hypothetical protein JWO94_2256 [Verrucomicrobiaceae bacterium]|nr:hypothetical protein [Verrucomicrobiaceae bacterium]
MTRRLTLLSLLAGFGLASGQDTPSPELPPPVPAQEQPGVTTAPPSADAAAPVSAPVPGADKAIPQAYSEEHYAGTWNRNPFLIETTVKGPVAGPGFGEDWELRGLTRNKGQPEALLGNKKTQEFHWVKMTEDKDGFKLIKANIDRDLHKSSVEVAKAGESGNATFTFPEVAAAPGGAGNGGRPNPGMPQNGAVPRPGVLGQPNNMVRPGMNPGMQGATGAGVPRVNPAFNNKPGAPMQVPAGQPNPPGRRRVLIPAAPSPAS